MPFRTKASILLEGIYKPKLTLAGLKEIKLKRENTCLELEKKSLRLHQNPSKALWGILIFIFLSCPHHPKDYNPFKHTP